MASDGAEDEDDMEELLEVFENKAGGGDTSSSRRRWIALLDLVRRWIRTVFALARNRMTQAVLSPWAENNNYLFSYSSITTSGSSSSTTATITTTICTGNGRTPSQTPPPPPPPPPTPQVSTFIVFYMIRSSAD
uniref:Uncharacterized protein n=1 Tax=Anopheles farauti TaxID=69004 RepID=A0A182Q7T6_9DIPT